MSDDIFIKHDKNGGSFQQPYIARVSVDSQEPVIARRSYQYTNTGTQPFTYQARTPASSRVSTNFQNTITAQRDGQLTYQKQAPSTYAVRSPLIYQHAQPSTYDHRSPSTTPTRTPVIYQVSYQARQPNIYSLRSPFIYQTPTDSREPTIYNHRSPFEYQHPSPLTYDHRSPLTYQHRSPSRTSSTYDNREPGTYQHQSPYRSSFTYQHRLPSIYTFQQPSTYPHQAQINYAYQANAQNPFIRNQQESVQQPNIRAKQHPFIRNQQESVQQPNIRAKQHPFIRSQQESVQQPNIRAQQQPTIKDRQVSTQQPNIRNAQSPYIANKQSPYNAQTPQSATGFLAVSRVESIARASELIAAFGTGAGIPNDINAVLGTGPTNSGSNIQQGAASLLASEFDVDINDTSGASSAEAEGGFTFRVEYVNTNDVRIMVKGDFGGGGSNIRRIGNMSSSASSSFSYGNANEPNFFAFTEICKFTNIGSGRGQVKINFPDPTASPYSINSTNWVNQQTVAGGYVADDFQYDMSVDCPIITWPRTTLASPFYHQVQVTDSLDENDVITTRYYYEQESGNSNTITPSFQNIASTGANAFGIGFSAISEQDNDAGSGENTVGASTIIEIIVKDLDTSVEHKCDLLIVFAVAATSESNNSGEEDGGGDE